MTVGETLKRARKKLNMDLDEVAQTTKIAKMFLIALENDEINSLPNGVYTRNFLRTYAKFLKLDEDIITAEYHEQFGVQPHFVAHQEQTKLDDLEYRKQKRRMQMVVLLVVLILIALAFFLIQSSWIDSFLRRADGVPVSSRSQSHSPSEEMSRIDSTEDAAELAADTARTDPLPSDPETPPGGMTNTVGEVADMREEHTATEEDQPGGTGDVGSSPGLEYGSVTHDESEMEVDEAKLPEETGEAVVETIGAPVHLPVTDLEHINWTPAGAGASDPGNMFAIESLATVWIQVEIDGIIITERYLRRGETRYYQYGNKHSLIVGDTSKIAVQDGLAFRAQADARNLTLTLRNFGPGELFKALDASIARIVPAED